MPGEAPSELAQQGRAFLGSYPELKHRWEEISSGVRLVFPTESADGFEISIEADGSAVLVGGVGFHTHFDWQGTVAENVRAALGLARDLLSPVMRVREMSTAGRPYKWQLQRFDGGEWRAEETTLSTSWGYVWNYFGRRSERIYQNTTLAPREEST